MRENFNLMNGIISPEFIVFFYNFENIFFHFLIYILKWNRSLNVRTNFHCHYTVFEDASPIKLYKQICLSNDSSFFIATDQW